MSGKRMRWRPVERSPHTQIDARCRSEADEPRRAPLSTPIEGLKRRHQAALRDMNQSASDPERFEAMARLAAELDAEVRSLEGNPRPPINLNDEGDRLVLRLALEVLVKDTSALQQQALRRRDYAKGARLGSFLAAVVAMKRVLP